MARITAYRQNYCPPATTTTVASGVGGIHSIIATGNSTTPAQLVFYDNTAGSGNILLTLYVSAYHAIAFNLKDIGPIRFTTGLTVVCPAGVAAFVVIEK
jgi:hypothetical protein